MTGSTYATPPDLMEAPELAVLAVLDHTLQQTAYALYAAYPELVDHHQPIGAANIGAALCLADIIAEQVASLQHTIVRYRQAVAADLRQFLPDAIAEF